MGRSDECVMAAQRANQPKVAAKRRAPRHTAHFNAVASDCSFATRLVPRVDDLDDRERDAGCD